jgi:hypothetical protein
VTGADPHFVKDQAIRREVDGMRQLGRPVDMRAIEQTVDAGMRRYYARKREMKRVGKLLKKAERAHRRGANPAEAMAASGGMRFFKRAIPTGPMGFSVAAPMPCSCGLCRDCKREIRVRDILQRARSGESTWFAFAKTLERIALNGKLGLNSYFGLSNHDRYRRVLREIEDVCDATTGMIGEWK